MDEASVGAHRCAPLPADRASPAPPAIADFACQISLGAGVVLCFDLLSTNHYRTELRTLTRSPSVRLTVAQEFFSRLLAKDGRGTAIRGRALCTGRRPDLLPPGVPGVCCGMEIPSVAE